MDISGQSQAAAALLEEAALVPLNEQLTLAPEVALTY
jgi:hypothetical protein